jgi:hypothetical protein
MGLTLLRFAALAGVLALGSVEQLQAQGRGKAKKVEPDGAVVATREVLVKHGYQVVRVETVGVTRVIYYRRGNMGKGKGLGPVEKMIVRPRGELVVFEGAPSPVHIDVKLRLGM